MILLFTLQFLTNLVDFELVLPFFTIISASRHRRINDEVVREILMDSNSENGDCLPHIDPDFDELDSESGSFDERLDLDNLDLNVQRLNNGPRIQLVQWGLTTQHSWTVALTPSLQGQGRMSYRIQFCFLYCTYMHLIYK